MSVNVPKQSFWTRENACPQVLWSFFFPKCISHLFDYWKCSNKSLTLRCNLSSEDLQICFQGRNCYLRLFWSWYIFKKHQAQSHNISSQKNLQWYLKLLIPNLLFIPYELWIPTTYFRSGFFLCCLSTRYIYRIQICMQFIYLFIFRNI